LLTRTSGKAMISVFWNQQKFFRQLQMILSERIGSVHWPLIPQLATGQDCSRQQLFHVDEAEVWDILDI
jgi:hypothetical protein